MFLFSQASKFDAIQVRLANKWRELVPRSALVMILGNRLPAGTKLVNLSSELTTPGVEEFFVGAMRYVKGRCCYMSYGELSI